MPPSMKKIALVVGFFVLIAAMGAAIYVVFFRPPSVRVLEEAVETPSPTSAGALPESGTGAPTPASGGEGTGAVPPARTLPGAKPVAEGGITKTTALTSSRVTAATLSQDGKGMQYYDKTDGRFYRIGTDGSVERLSDEKFSTVEQVTWAKDGVSAVLEFPDGSNVVYNFSAGKQVSLPRHWEDFYFAPDGEEILAKSIGVDPSNRALVITKTDGTNTRAIAALGNNADKVIPSWSPNDQVVAFSDTGPTLSGFGRKMIIPIGKNEEQFKGVVVEGFDFKPLWNPQGNSLVYSAVGEINGYRPMLWVVNGRGESIGDRRRTLGIETWADKCTFSSGTNLYCAVPQELPANTGLQRQLAGSQADAIYRINIDTGETELVAIPDIPQSIDSIQVSSDGGTLFFTNAATGILETMRLK